MATIGFILMFVYLPIHYSRFGAFFVIAMFAFPFCYRRLYSSGRKIPKKEYDNYMVIWFIASLIILFLFGFLYGSFIDGSYFPTTITYLTELSHLLYVLVAAAVIVRRYSKF